MHLCVWRDNICDFETEWIKYILPSDTLYISQNEKETKYPNTPCVFITSFWHEFEHQIIDIKHDFGVIYLSEEILSIKMDSFINNPYCKFIWRNYIHPKYYENPKVTHFPCAYKNGFTQYISHAHKPAENQVQEDQGQEDQGQEDQGQEDQVQEQEDQVQEDQKDYLWSFAGAVHGPERSLPLQIFKMNLEPYKIHETPAGTFNASEGLSTEEYVKLIQKSKYVICPPGKIIMECSRLYEALEGSAVPIVIANDGRNIQYTPSYHHYVFPRSLGEPPFIIVEDWNDAVSIINNIESKNEYLKLLETCSMYWYDCKMYWKELMLGHLTAFIS